MKSRTGILFTFGTVLILWSSKLQSEIVLFTLEAKYIALSKGKWDLAAAHRLLTEIRKRIQFNLERIVHESKAWDDNTGTQTLAKNMY